MKARFKAGEVQDKQNRVEGARLQSNSSHKSGGVSGQTKRGRGKQDDNQNGVSKVFCSVNKLNLME